eukprot:13507369-Alexandrium_andersonii.AAC.1
MDSRSFCFGPSPRLCATGPGLGLVGLYPARGGGPPRSARIAPPLVSRLPATTPGGPLWGSH